MPNQSVSTGRKMWSVFNAQSTLVYGYMLVAIIGVFCQLQSPLYDETQTKTITTTTKTATVPDNERSTKIGLTKESIKSFIAAKRIEHRDAIERLRQFSRYEQRFEIMRRVFGKIFEIMESSRAAVQNSNYILGDDISTSNNDGDSNNSHRTADGRPLKPEVIQHILHILDNCAFFGDLALKLPDIAAKLLHDNQRWTDSYRWCFTFAVNSNLIDSTSAKMFGLAAQQLNLVPRSADFVNPYLDEAKRKAKAQRKKEAKKSPISASNRSKREPQNTNKRSKGPRLSRAEL